MFQATFDEGNEKWCWREHLLASCLDHSQAAEADWGEWWRTWPCEALP